MGFWDHVGWVQAAYNSTLSSIMATFSNLPHDYVSPQDDEEDNTSEYEWVTSVVIGTPLRETKFLFVPELNDFYTDNELNTLYHSADEYRHAIDKYGIIYKSQKFNNADTVDKLFEYAKDWIKNNYHGGITSFTVTALDLHLIDPNYKQFLVGQRVNVSYMDPALHSETTQTLTVVSAEYDLLNPENNAYKIGIPDIAVNKVYGDTAKKGGGGGGGGKTSDETDTETDTTVEQVMDEVTASTTEDTHNYWALMYRTTRDNDGTFDTSSVLPPGVRDQTSDFFYGLTADLMNSSYIQGVNAKLDNIKSAFVQSTGGVDCETVSANKGNVTNVNSEKVKATEKVDTKDLAASNNASVGEKLTTKDLQSTGTADIKSLKLNGSVIRFAVVNNQPRLTIGSRTFTLAVE